MKHDVLGNLEQWGRVLEQLDEWMRAGQLDCHQDDLLWLLRFRGNWRLREAALEMAASLQVPSPALIQQVCGMMMNEELYHEIRILAAETLTALLSRRRDSDPSSESAAGEVRKCMHALLESPQPPVIHLALRRMLPRI